MPEIAAYAGRSHGCGEPRAADCGAAVGVCGWVHARRDHGGVHFVDLRDRSGVLQLVADEDANESVQAAMRDLHPEDCIAARGRLRMRIEGQRKKDKPTGEVELLVEEIEVLSRSERVPFEIVDELDVPEELRLQYRYLDLRRPPVRHRIEQRSAANRALREALHGMGFTEVETPLLTRSTPEGARDYLVPSRVRPGSWYALPQSPQIFKQLCMVGGLERYFQIARCLRDEDLRADRQPEFTQLDLEMSFVEEEAVITVVERVVAEVWKATRGTDLSLPLPRMTHAEALRRYASDKPDLRNPLEVVDLAAVAGGIGFRVFDGVLEAGGLVQGLRLPRGASLSRKQIEGLVRTAQEAGAGGAAWSKIGPDGPSGPLGRFLKGQGAAAFLALLGAREGDLILAVADRPRRARVALDALRRRSGELLGMVEDRDRFVWVTEFPLFEEDDDGTWKPAHHPFTAPHPDDLEALLVGGREGIRSRAYDLVLNGVELGSGSVRIHRRDLQEAVFEAIGLDPEEARRRFSFLLEAFRYGPPPHAGFAIGLDRFYALLFGAPSIRDVIAFPKTSSGACPLTGAPAPVDPEQIAELGLVALSQPTADPQGSRLS